jgi:ATP-binding cassette subfamily B protein
MIYEILDLEPPQGDIPGAAELKVAEGRIAFRDVHFGYSPDMPVLRGISLEIAPGTTTAIVGPSGSGKTTLIALLQRFYDPDRGAILIDGQDIAGVTKQSLRSSIAYVSQAPFLFEGSIADNIRYGKPDATMDEVRAAARLAYCAEFIEKLPRGYDTPLGESGSNLSGGQRQRISIARALVRDAPILLLDEATSALDNESEKKVQQALQTVMEGRTTIVVAHRLSTVVRADTIVVLDEGNLVEQGTHVELKSRRQGVYARFYRLGAGVGLDIVDDTAGEEPAERRTRARKKSGDRNG